MKQCDTYPGFYGPSVEVICIDLFDDPTEGEAHKYPGDAKPFFRPTNEAIKRHIAAGNGVMIHCMASLSRSIAFVCAYLIEVEGMTLLESLAKIRVRSTPASVRLRYYVTMFTVFAHFSVRLHIYF